MVAYFEVQKNEGDVKRILKVDNVRGAAHAKTIALRLRAAHVDKVRLLSLEEDALHYTASEVEKECNLLGRVRRYSTGDRTVTIPEGN